MNLRPVWFGLDTFEASIGGRLGECPALVLEATKRLAQETDCPQPLDTGLLWAVQPTGGKPYRYKLQSEEAHVRLTPAKGIPTASVKLTSLGLQLYGPEPLFELVSEFVAHLGATEPAKASRADVAIDFQGFVPPCDPTARFVCAAEFRPVYPNTERPETYQFGKGDMVARVYNKTRELNVSRKHWLRSVWERCPDFDPAEDVWRFEGQFRRDRLRGLGLETPQQVFDRLPALLLAAMEWCDLRVHDGGPTDRMARHPAWEQLALAVPSPSRLTRMDLGAARAQLPHIVPVVAGYAVSAGVALGCTDRDKVLAVLCDEIRDRWDEAEYAERVATRRLERLG